VPRAQPCTSGAVEVPAALRPWPPPWLPEPWPPEPPWEPAAGKPPLRP
jgi:hypothetical protein